IVSPGFAEAFSVVAGDFNNDGNLDLAAYTGTGAGQVWVTLGNGDGTFRSPTFLNAGVIAYGPPLLVADFNGDGILDLVISGFGQGAYGLSVMLGLGDGNFAAGLFYPDITETSILAT